MCSHRSTIKDDANKSTKSQKISVTFRASISPPHFVDTRIKCLSQEHELYAGVRFPKEVWISSFCSLSWDNEGNIEKEHELEEVYNGLFLVKPSELCDTRKRNFRSLRASEPHSFSFKWNLVSILTSYYAGKIPFYTIETSAILNPLFVLGCKVFQNDVGKSPKLI